jgi:plastocyanin
MTPRFRIDPPRTRSTRSTRSTRLALATACLACAAPGALHAAALNLNLTDAVGAPLPDAVALLEPASGRPAVKPMADVDVSQAKRQFSPRVTVITTGTRVNFPNFDTVRHHVYSFSPIKTFELKLYAGVPGAPVLFDKPGIAVLGCNIHDTMAAWIVVADTPWSARTAANGQARIDAIPPGSYRLRLWHPGLPPNTEPPPVALTIGPADAEYGGRIAVRAEP